MARNKAQLQRLIFVDRSIREGMQNRILANCGSMAAEYEVSYKSIMRDIDYLKHQCDAPIEYDQQLHGYYYTEDSYQLPAISISESDLFAIYIARKALQQYRNTPIYRKLASVFTKIEESLPDRVSVSPDWVEERVSVFSDQQTEISPVIWDTVAEALHKNHRLKVSYLKPGADRTDSREVDPYHVVSFQGEWYLIGFCHLRQEIRTFALSRIKRAEAQENTYSIPHDFSFEQFSGRQFGIFRSDRLYEVSVHFSAGNAPYVQEREWHAEQAITQQKDGSIILSFPTSHLFEVKRWVLSWGSGVEVLAPPELRRDVRAELEKALRAYN